MRLAWIIAEFELQYPAMREMVVAIALLLAQPRVIQWAQDIHSGVCGFSTGIGERTFVEYASTVS
jgi:hypothetical protein